MHRELTSDVLQDMYSHPRVNCVLMTGNVPSPCGVGLVFHIKHITFESVNDPRFSLFNMFGIATVTFQAINQITTLASAMAS